MRKVSTIKLVDLIKGLQEVLAAEGNLPVVMSRDEEGNGFNTLSAEDFTSDCVSVEQGICILYPWAERQDLDDIQGSKACYDDEDEADEEEEDDDEPPYGCNFNDDE
jgi:hypothetical protein